MLTYSSCHEIYNSLVLDEILYDGDTLYKRTINNLKAQAKFVHLLLSLEEIPDIIEIEKGQFIVEKQPIVVGILVNDYEEQGLPTLHCALQSAFTRAPSILLVIGAICYCKKGCMAIKIIPKAFLKPISRTKICDSKEKHRAMRTVHLL